MSTYEYAERVCLGSQVQTQIKWVSKKWANK